MIVDGKVVGFNAGWETPNNPKEWSAAIGLHDFSIKDLGIALLMEDLRWIKDAGYKTCDLEGSDPPALRFKTQFFPAGHKSYKTYTFWLDKKQMVRYVLGMVFQRSTLKCNTLPDPKIQ